MGNNSAPPLAPHMLGIPGGSRVTTIQQAKIFPAEGHAPMSGTEQNLHRAMMGGTPTLQNAGLVGNLMGGLTSIKAAPLAATATRKQQFWGMRSTVRSALMFDVKMFWLAAKTQGL